MYAEFRTYYTDHIMISTSKNFSYKLRQILYVYILITNSLYTVLKNIA